jgi:vacuolar-type H+-ATPase subunit E/Vma4
MGYGELLRALADEARAEAGAVLAAARAERERLLSTAREASGAVRGRALEGLRAELDAEASRGRARGEAEADRVVVAEARRLLDELRDEAARRLAARAGPEVTLRMLDRALEDDGGEALEIRVDADHVDEARAHLARRHPAAAARATVLAADEPRGGAEVRFGAALVVDETLRSRLDRALALLEPELSRALLGGPDGAL